MQCLFHVPSLGTKNEPNRRQKSKRLYVSPSQGFFLEGARWDREQRCLVDMVPKQLHDQLPIVLFQPAAMPDEEEGESQVSGLLS